VVNDTASDTRFLGRVDEKTGYVTRQLLVVPLRGSDDAVLGAFQALNKEGGFVPGDIDLLQLAASYSASAIEEQRYRKEAERARLLMQELEIAREVQQQLFPKHLPEVAGLEYRSYCRPAKFVGGDYYDYFWLGDGNVALTLGDVAGKGISAAIMMASIQSSLRSLLLRGATSLAKAMDEFNQMVYESSPTSRYSTLFCSIYEPESRRLTYVNAGQEPPLLIRDDGEDRVIERLRQGGMPIGLVPGAKYEEGSLILRPGDVQVCYSDGISEVADPEGKLWDEQRVEDLIWENRRGSAQELIDVLLKAADEYAAGAAQHDDMTLSVSRILQEPER
jgi:sigma-B regulation protein RsbU (phosphoserine phosphatase)